MIIMGKNGIFIAYILIEATHVSTYQIQSIINTSPQNQYQIVTQALLQIHLGPQASSKDHGLGIIAAMELQSQCAGEGPHSKVFGIGEIAFSTSSNTLTLLFPFR